MNVDPIQILQVTMYSKIINETISVATENNKYIYWGLFLFAMVRVVQLPYTKQYLKNWLDSWEKKRDESFIIIPQHKRVFTTFCGGQSRETVQLLYSDRFRAINHYLEKHHPEDINKMVEISRRETKSVWENEVIDYLLLPVHNERILLNKNLGIYFEISITEEQKDGDDKKTKDVTSYKNYTYKLTKYGKNQYSLLNRFMEDCITTYKNETINKKEQSIFEYIKYKKDDEDRYELVFRKYPFRSNKFLDKNIFFEGKPEFIKYVDQFVKKTDSSVKTDAEKQYEDAGVTFKAGILMTGPPGCGKSSTIRGILNRTGRNGVVVSWSSITSSSEFRALMRSTKINDVQYEPGELCFIFEDFDANLDEVLKTRDQCSEFDVITSDFCSIFPQKEGSESKDDTELSKKRSFIEQMMMAQNHKKDDALTLECVLNTIDGIIELHDIMLIFTTNHIEKIDPAFTRPGRMDYVLKLTNASSEIIREMVRHKYREDHEIDWKDYDYLIHKIKGNIISPAEVQLTCLKYGKGQIKDCLNELVKKTN